MREKVWLAEVIVGELLLAPPSLHHGHHTTTPSHILPIISVEVCSGPVLHIPFLAADRTQVWGGHSCLPQEVEESYLAGGRFVFQRGKSCLFTIPEKDWGEQDTEATTAELHCQKDQTGWEGRIKIAVLNGFHSPPTVYGRCEAVLKGHSRTKVNQTLKGKVRVLNEKEEIVSNLTISVSCQDLGEDVAHHIQSLIEREGKVGSSHKMLGVTCSPEALAMNGKSSLHTLYSQQECSKSKQVRSISPANAIGSDMQSIAHEQIGPELFSTSAYDFHVNNSKLYQEFECYPCVQTSSHNTIKETDLTPSEQIALKIEELYKSQEDAYLQTFKVPQVRYESTVDSHQVPPIIHISQNTKAERMWNEKMQNLGEHMLETNSRTPNDVMPKVSSNIPAPSSTDGLKSTKRRDNHREKLSSTTDSAITSKGSKRSPSYLKVLSRPTGWLRSTPIAPTHNTVPHPKLNRTHLLRRANLDPQLACQLQAEVDHQVKHRLKQIDEGLKAQLEKVQKGKVWKGPSQRMQSVGCQTVDCLNNYSSPQEFSSVKNVYEHQVERTSNSNPNTLQNHHDVENREIMNSGVLLSSRIKSKEMQRNLTFEIDVPERVEEDPTNVMYEADFDIPSPHLSNTTYNQLVDQSTSSSRMMHAATKTKAAYSTTASESLSTSSSQPRHKERHQYATLTSQDTNLREKDNEGRTLTQLDMAREPSQDTAQTYTVHGDHSRVTRGSHEITSQDSSQQSEYLSAESSKKQSLESNHSSSRSMRKSKLFQFSRVSRDSDISVEVCKEILKGKQADFLARAGSRLTKPQEYSTTPEDIFSIAGSYKSCTTGSVKGEEVEEEEGISEVYQKTSERNGISEGEGIYSGDGSSILSSYSQPEDSSPIVSNISSPPQTISSKVSSSQILNSHSIGMMKSFKTVPSSISERYSAHITKLNSHEKSIDSTLTSRVDQDGQISDKLEQDFGRVGQETSRAGQNRGKGEQDVGTASISDISARIAALLVKRRLSVAKINTDSESSYIPSEVCDTMSSLSDMTQD